MYESVTSQCAENIGGRIRDGGFTQYSCTFSQDILRGSVWNLRDGDDVFCQVTAENNAGQADVCAVGSGA